MVHILVTMTSTIPAFFTFLAHTIFVTVNLHDLDLFQMTSVDEENLEQQESVFLSNDLNSIKLIFSTEKIYMCTIHLSRKLTKSIWKYLMKRLEWKKIFQNLYCYPSHTVGGGYHNCETYPVERTLGRLVHSTVYFDQIHDTGYIYQHILMLSTIKMEHCSYWVS